MLKSKAIRLLGGSPSAAADAVGVSSSAVSQWPDVLPARIADRVLAALARRHLPPELLAGDAEAPPSAASQPPEVSHAAAD